MKYTIFRIDTVTETLGTKGDVALCIGDVVWVKYDAWKVALRHAGGQNRPILFWALAVDWMELNGRRGPPGIKKKEDVNVEQPHKKRTRYS